MNCSVSVPALLRSIDSENVSDLSRLRVPVVFTAYSRNSPLNGMKFIGTRYRSPVFSTACKKGEPRATCSTLLMLMFGVHSWTSNFLKAGDDGVVPAVASST